MNKRDKALRDGVTACAWIPPEALQTLTRSEDVISLVRQRLNIVQTSLEVLIKDALWGEF